MRKESWLTLSGGAIVRICYLSHAKAHFTLPYVDHFRAEGHDVHVISCQEGDVPGATTHHPLDRPFDPKRESAAYFWVAPKVRRLIRKIQPDLVHAHYVTSNGMLAAWSRHHPMVVTAHGSDVIASMPNPVKRWLVRRVMRQADLVNPVSRDLQTRIVGMGIPASRVLWLSQGVETERFNLPRRSRGDGLRLICIRQLAPVYDCPLVLQAMALLRDRGVAVQCEFAATGPDEGDLRSLSEELRLQAQVTFRGGYTQAELPRLLAEADVYVSASRWDGTSVSLLEAMAAGIYPVVSDIPANRAWLTGDGDAGFFPTGDAAAFADALHAVVQNPDLRVRAVDRLRTRVRHEGDRKTNMNRLGQEYERLVAAHGVRI